MPAKPRRISQLLRHHTALRSLYAEIQQQQQLLGLVRKSLPPSLARHCMGVRLHDNVLSLFTDTPVWVSKFRFQAPTLLSALRSRYPAIASIAVRCNTPQRQPTARRKLPAARHSNHAAEAVDQGAEGVQSPALRAALKRLARAMREK